MKQFYFIPSVLAILFALGCTKKNQNKVTFEPFLLSTGALDYYIGGDVDTDVIPDCGVASSASTTSSSSKTATAKTAFTIISQLVIKTTKENLSLKFKYDLNQTQGAIDPQQGFIMTGGNFGNTVVGTQGTVKWPGGIGTIDQSCAGNQSLQYFGLELSLAGYYRKGFTSTQRPTTCKTIDNVNCNSSGTIDCYTTDNKTCLSTAVRTCTTNDQVSCIDGGTATCFTLDDASCASSLPISGKINCNHPNVIPNCG